MIVTRGGGSIEDLWCFNDEAVAKAIRRSQIPVVTGIGHEIDFTIADFAADVRAPTPSAAAELVVPDRRTLLLALNTSSRRLRHAAARQLERVQGKYQQLLARLERAHPGNRLAQQVQRLDELDMRLRRSWVTRHTTATQRLQLAQRSLNAISPLATLQRGYAIVTGPNGAAVTAAAQLKAGDDITARLASGTIAAKVLTSNNVNSRE
jgi:exodeoxyribonuclease VII large subunit